MLNEDTFDLLDNLASLCLDGPQPRQTGLLQAVEMGWNSTDCRLGQQFKNIYISRMQKMRSRFSIPGVTPIAEVRQNNQRYYICGIIKRLQARRIRAFQKYFDDKYLSSQPIYNEKDQIQIEDRGGKLKLTVTDCMIGGKKIQSNDLPYGVMVVIQGKFKKLQNKFVVKNIFLPSLAPQKSFKTDYVNSDGVSYTDKKMLIVSEPTFDQLANLQHLLKKTYSYELKSISGIVIIGGMQMKPQSIIKMAGILKDLKDMIDVFIMPSSNQDRRKMYPLQPYNGNFFAESQREIGLCCNPQLFKAENGMNIHVTCGENVLDFMKNCNYASSEIEVLQGFVNFSHFCPTSPFSLKTEPYQNDYLIMEQIPNIIVTGKAKSFDSKILEVEGRSVLLVSIPAGQMGLISLNGLHACSFN